MKKNTPSDGILVFDRYYGKKPVVVLLVALRVLFCSAFSAAAMLYVFSQYDLRAVSLGYVGTVSALSAALLSLLFIVVKRRYVIPVLIVGSGLLIYRMRGDFFEKLSYFADEFMLLAEGRFIEPRGFLFNNPDELSLFNHEYREGMLLGTFLLCTLFSFLCAASMKRRIRAVPAVLAVCVLCVPCLLAESFDINGLFIPFVLLAAAAVAISLNYSDGLAVVRSGGSAYRSQIKADESRLVSKSDKVGMIKRISMQICFYSKYATTGFYCAALFAIVFFVGISVFDSGEAIDYTAMFEYFEDLGDDDAEVTLNDDKVSDYFSGSEDKREGLSITSPGRGNSEVIRVSFTGDAPIYLRGDIGVEFTGVSWLTPVNDEAYWTSSGLAESYRPAELRILSLLLDELCGGTVNVASESDITIDYLTETDVVFLPAYTGDYSYYNNENFDVYGDYCVRVSDTAGSYINTVKCTAVVHDIFTADSSDRADVISLVQEILDEYGLTVNDLFSSVVMSAGSEGDVLAEYSELVDETYLDVPADISVQLRSFMSQSGLADILDEYRDLDSTALYRYLTAAAIDDYLKTNYTYSLSNSNRGEGAVMRFLTETKQGHCSLYASAMTLMLREMDIPARYCTGFALHPDTVRGSTKVFREKDLHAWVEVYIDELGWVTFDPTSAAVNALNSGRQDETEQAPAQTTSRPVRTDVPDVTDEPELSEDASEQADTEEQRESGEPSDTSEAGEGGTHRKPVPIKMIVCVCCVLVVLTAVAAAVRHYCIVRKRAEQALASSAWSGADVYDCIVDILEYSGLTPELGELPEAFYRRADTALGTGLAAERELLEAAAFGGSTDGDRKARLLSLLGALYRSAVKRSGCVRRYRTAMFILNRFRKHKGIEKNRKK